MKKTLIILLASILCILFATLGVSASTDVDNAKYIPKVITTDNGYKMMFDSELARIARRMSSDSYGIAIDSNVQDISKTFQAEDFEDIRQSHFFDEPFMDAFSNNFLVGVKTFEVDGVQKHVLAIAFRGTQVKDGFDYADLFTDASVLGLNGFHSGFYAAALKAYDTLYDMEFPSLKNEDGSSMTFSDYLAHSGVVGSDYSILVTGHSLGGAVANIFAGDIISQFGKSNVMCYTFASPIVCSPTKAKEYDAYNIFNIINTNDIVPNVGYNLFAGVRLGNDLKVTVTDSEESAHSLSVTYEKATNQVIDSLDSLYPFIHRVCTDSTDEIHIHTDCSLEERRFPDYLPIDTLKIVGNISVNTGMHIKGTIEHDSFAKSKLIVNEKIEVGKNWEIPTAGSVELNADVLVGKNLLQGGELIIKKAKFEVMGNCEFGRWSPSKNVYMEDEESYLLVHGYFQHFTNGSSENLTAGTIEIKGDMIECGGYRPSGTHKTVLSGNTLQNIDMLGYNQYGHFNILELKNTSVDGILFDIKANVHADIIQPIGTKIANSSYLILQNRTAFVDYGDLNSQINVYNGNAENAIPTWLDYERYCKFALDGDNAFILNESITDTTFTCDLYFSNDYSKTSAVVIVAFYDGDNRFVQMVSKPVEVKAGKIDVSTDYESKPYSKYKIMVWESFDNLQPLMATK